MNAARARSRRTALASASPIWAIGATPSCARSTIRAGPEIRLNVRVCRRAFAGRSWASSSPGDRRTSSTIIASISAEMPVLGDRRGARRRRRRFRARPGARIAVSAYCRRNRRRSEFDDGRHRRRNRPHRRARRAGPADEIGAGAGIDAAARRAARRASTLQRPRRAVVAATRASRRSSPASAATTGRSRGQPPQLPRGARRADARRADRARRRAGRRAGRRRHRRNRLGGLRARRGGGRSARRRLGLSLRRRGQRVLASPREALAAFDARAKTTAMRRSRSRRAAALRASSALASLRAIGRALLRAADLSRDARSRRSRRRRCDSLAAARTSRCAAPTGSRRWPAPRSKRGVGADGRAGRRHVRRRGFRERVRDAVSSAIPSARVVAAALRSRAPARCCSPIARPASSRRMRAAANERARPLRGGLIVSVQAWKGSAIDDPRVIAAMARAAQDGGAVARARRRASRDLRAVASARRPADRRPDQARVRGLRAVHHADAGRESRGHRRQVPRSWPSMRPARPRPGGSDGCRGRRGDSRRGPRRDGRLRDGRGRASRRGRGRGYGRDDALRLHARNQRAMRCRRSTSCAKWRAWTPSSSAKAAFAYRPQVRPHSTRVPTPSWSARRLPTSIG